MLDESEEGAFVLIVFGFFRLVFLGIVRGLQGVSSRPHCRRRADAPPTSLRVGLWRDDADSTIDMVVPVGSFLAEFPPTPVNTTIKVATTAS